MYTYIRLLVSVLPRQAVHGSGPTKLTLKLLNTARDPKTLRLKPKTRKR